MGVTLNKKQEYRDFITEIVKLFGPKVYVELGTRLGYTFNSIAPYCEKAIAVDLVIKGISNAPNVECYEMSSKDFSFLARTWAPKIDLLFIDADHCFKEVMNDFDSFFDFVVPETGLILLHDTFPVEERLLKDDRCSDAWKAAKFIRGNYGDKCESVTLPGPWAGLTIIRKVGHRHGWMDKEK